MKQKNLAVLFAAALLASCSTTPKKEVHLKGQFKGLSEKQYVLAYNGASAQVGKSRDIRLSVNEDGSFDTILPMEKPEYYSIYRNSLYLSPGDDMEIFITPENTEAQFSGKGAEANNYLRNRLFPHGGSFLESGQNVRDDFASTRSVVDSLAAIRYAQIDTLSGVSETFKALEKARITADVINSYVYYMYYGKEAKNLSSREEIQEFRGNHANMIAEYVNPLYKQISADEYLDVAVVRDVFSYREESDKWFEGVEETPFAKMLYRAVKYAGTLDNEPTPENLKEIVTALPEFSDTTIVKELNIKIEKARTLQPGQPAPDFVLTDISGAIKHLSDFKGKLIYIDFWATWCGPCIAESPYFEELAGKLSDKDIIFLPVSVDNTTDVWLKYLEKHEKKLPQYHSADPELSDKWNIRFIPRFVLIDRDLKIVNAYATRPSDEETANLLKSL